MAAANLRALATRLGAREIKRLSREAALIRQETALDRTERKLRLHLARVSRSRERLGRREGLHGQGANMSVLMKVDLSKGR